MNHFAKFVKQEIKTEEQFLNFLNKNQILSNFQNYTKFVIYLYLKKMKNKEKNENRNKNKNI
jgi:hypothetical protein